MDFSATVSDGGKVFLDSCYYDSTYAGLLEGRPDRQLNLERLKSWPDFVQRIWPGVPAVVLNVEGYRSAADQPFQPIMCAARFISYNPVSPESGGDASSLVAIWFQASIGAIEENYFIEGLRNLNWPEHARDFYW